jgi:hypothetical protein
MNIHRRVRFVLPLTQAAVACALIASFLAPPHPEDFAKTEYQIYRALNAPAFLLSAVPARIAHWVYRKAYFIVETTVRLCFVWLVWYAVSIEISGRGRSVLSPRTRVRRVADALAVIFGAAVALSGGYGLHPPAIWMLYLIWGVVIMGFYGRDLWVSLRCDRAPGE